MESGTNKRYSQLSLKYPLLLSPFKLTHFGNTGGRTFSEGTPLSYLGRQGRVRPGERVSEQLFEGYDYVAIIVPESLKRLDTGVSSENRALGEGL